MFSIIPFVVVGTLISGACNSLLTKLQDNQCVRNCSNPDISTHKNFEQPVIQTLQMFIGELSMFIVYYILYHSRFAMKNRADYALIEDNEDDNSKAKLSLFRRFQLTLPSICDLCGTTLMNIGLVYTPVSIYQMTRGSTVLFVAILSVLFLKRRITKLEWVSLFFVALGVTIVGYSGSAHSDSPSGPTKETAPLIMFGIACIIVAGLCQAFQFVIEEHILSIHSIPPIKLVYYEGFYGTTILLLLMVLLNFIVGSMQPHDRFRDSTFNLVESFSQVFSSNAVLISSVLIMISISIFNFCGITLTHKLSAAARSTIDTCRTLLVWLFAITVGWESFYILQFFGFAVLVFGTLCFNGILKPEKWDFVPNFLKESELSNERLIDVIDEPIERM